MEAKGDSKISKSFRRLGKNSLELGSKIGNLFAKAAKRDLSDHQKCLSALKRRLKEFLVIGFYFS